MRRDSRYRYAIATKRNLMHRLSFVLIALLPGIAEAQDSSRTQRDTVPRPTASVRSGIDLSGVLFASYQTGGPPNDRAQNRFDIERVYLTFLAPAGDRVSVRFTTDIYVQRDSTRDGYYRGWAMRAKYAWLQYQLMKPRRSGAAAVVRLGLVHTPIAEYEEGFFLRYVSPGSLETFFQTADAGAGGLWTLPSRRGEVYVSVLNGNGYTSRETDRFKDYGARVSLTPLADRGSGSVWSTLSITPWYYKGYRASTAAATLNAARQKDRYGLFAGVRDPRLRLGLQLARRAEEIDLAGSPAPREITGAITSAFIVAKPLALSRPKNPGPAAVIFRMDAVRPDLDTKASYRLLIAGLQLDLSSRAAMSLDVQTQTPRDGSTALSTRRAFLHLLANF